MFKVPEVRMLKTIPKGKYNKNVNMDHVMDEKTEMNVNVGIITGDMHNTEYEEVEKRMIKTNLKGKNNVATPIEDPKYCTLVTTTSIVQV
jgi:hypothetical protein